MVWKLLRKNISAWHIVIYLAANIAGLLVVSLGLQFARDIKAGRQGGDGSSDILDPARYIIVSHQPRTSIFGNRDNSLTPDEISGLQSQGWVDGADSFLPAGFDITLRVNLPGAGFSTDIFFEGIPEKYLDIPHDSWTFDPASPVIPVILPRDYLSLYNFGFAQTRGLPVLDENTVRMLPLEVTVSGNGRSMTLPAKIAGFSSRLNTIAVPDSFINWGNSEFSPSGSPSPTRMIVRLANPGDPAIGEYLAAHNLTTSTDEGGASRMYHFLSVVAGAVMAIGAVISLLAAALLIMSLFLILQKNRDIIARLILIGYSPGYIARRYSLLADTLVILSYLLSLPASCLLISSWHTQMQRSYIATAGILPTLLITAAAVILMAAVSNIIIYRSIYRIARPGR